MSLEISRWLRILCGVSKMGKIIRCVVCNEKVDKVSKALCQKLFDIKTKKIMCLSCLSNELEVDEESLLEKAKELREAGCTLFK